YTDVATLNFANGVLTSNSQNPDPFIPSFFALGGPIDFSLFPRTLPNGDVLADGTPDQNEPIPQPSRLALFLLVLGLASILRHLRLAGRSPTAFAPLTC